MVRSRYTSDLAENHTETSPNRSEFRYIIIYLWLGWRAGWSAPPAWQSHGVKIKHTHHQQQQQPNAKVEEKEEAIQSPKKQTNKKTKHGQKRRKDQKDRQFSHTRQRILTKAITHALLKYWSHFYCPEAEQFPSPFYTFTLHRIHLAPKILHLHILNFNIIFLQLQNPIFFLPKFTRTTTITTTSPPRSGERT